MTIEAKFHIDRGKFVLDVELKVPSRGVTAIFGPSGSGKTTLLRLMAGLERDPSGYLSVSGDIWQDGETFLPTHQRALGYVFQEASLFPHLSVRGNLEYGFKRVAQGELQLAFDDAVALLGLQGMLDRPPAGLSGGERQRVAIARTLLTSPRLLLMDEPLASLDAESKSEIIPFLERLHEELKIPMLYVSHAFDEVARLADHLVMMKLGRVEAAGPFIEMMNRPDGPLTQYADEESVIEATVAGHDEDYALTQLDFPGGQFTVARTRLPVGHTVRVRVMARDVSLALERPTGSSVLNILPATVQSVSNDEAGQSTVRLDVGEGVSMLSRITRKSSEALGLEQGKPVFAQVKSVALLGPYRQAGE